MSFSEARTDSIPSVGALPRDLESTTRTHSGILLLICNAGLTASFGLFYMVLALTATLLPSESSYLGMSESRLCELDECHLVDFLAHGRMSYGGALVGVGVMTGWLTMGPLKRGEQWAWWTLLLAGGATYGNFLSFVVSNGYLDWSLTLLAGIGAPLCILGLMLTHRRSNHVGLIDAFRIPGIGAWLTTRRGRARLILAALGVSIGFAGVGILVIASSFVFVPQDTAFLKMNLGEVSAIADRLKPLMSHDRAAYGGTMVAIAVLFAATALRALGAGETGAKRALLVSGVIFYLSTVAIHLAIGYTNLVHLLPVYAGFALFLVALGFLSDAKPLRSR